MKKISISFIKLMPAIILSVACITANAQKQPAIQEISLRAPANIKIDGKTTEWDDKFQAKNVTDRIVYTISNDDNKLYLTVRAQGARGGAKIISGGLTFTISHEVDKKKREKGEGNVSFTFPIVTDRAKSASITAKQYHYWDNLAGDLVKNKGAIDSLHMAIDAQIGEACKEIKITGIKDLDTISVYNTEGIKAVCAFNSTFICVYEMAIPLKLLGLSTDNPVKFSYNIKLNAVRAPQSAAGVRSISVSGGVIDIRQSGTMNMDGPMMPIMMGPPNPDTEYLNNDTSFWAEYTLAAK